MISEQDHGMLRRLHEATNETVRRLEAENATLNAKLSVMEAEKRQWQVERVVQSRVIQDTLARANATSSGYLVEIERLRAELREARVK